MSQRVPGPIRARRALARAGAGLGIGVTLFAGAGAPGALAETLELRWMQPAGSPPVTEFRVYLGSVVGEGGVVFRGLPTPVGGIHSVHLAIPASDGETTLYVWVTAVNRGGEGRPSRPLVLGRPHPPVGAPGLPHFVLD